MFAAQKIECLNSGISALNTRLWPELITIRLILWESASSVEAGIILMKDEPEIPNCRNCRYFYITWDARNPMAVVRNAIPSPVSCRQLKCLKRMARSA